MAKKGASLKEKDVAVRNSRKLYIPVYFMIITLICLIVIIRVEDLPLNKAALIAAIVFILIGIKFTEVHRLGNKYRIDFRSLIHTKGYFNIVSRKVDLLAVSDIDVSQTLWQRLWGYGDVNVRMFSKDSNTSVKNINNPDLFASMLQKKMRGRRVREA